MKPNRLTLAARRGRAFRLEKGRCVELINTHGSQVVDTWAFNTEDMAEYLSAEHTRSCLQKLIPGVGDSLYSTRRRPILTVVADTSPGVHDLLLSACDQDRYRLLGHEGPHENCADNLRAALAEIGLVVPTVPSPWNVFENVAIGPGGALEIQAPPVRPGQSLTFRVEMDAVVVFSICPMDLVPTNGPDMTPRDVDCVIT